MRKRYLVEPGCHRSDRVRAAVQPAEGLAEHVRTLTIGGLPSEPYESPDSAFASVGDSDDHLIRVRRRFGLR